MWRSEAELACFERWRLAEAMAAGPRDGPQAAGARYVQVKPAVGPAGLACARRAPAREADGAGGAGCGPEGSQARGEGGAEDA